MLKKIKVYGTLRKFLGQSEFEVDLNTPQEAISFLKCNFDGVEKHMARQHYTIQCGSKVITEDLLNMSTQEDIRIIPLVHGNIFGIVFGAAALFGGKAIATGALVGSFAAIAGSVLTSIGTSMLINGVTSLLSPQQSTSSVSGLSSQDPAALGANYSFTGLTNISNAGVPVNLVYGEIMVGSIVVSNGVDTIQVT
jgi:predicted phage tail protein